jgi:glutamine---fructose-6-phosphate transaminase (isomerizing)
VVTTASLATEETVPTEFSIIEGEYLGDILDQPRAMQETLKGLEDSDALQHIAGRLRKAEFRAIVLTGMGSSFHVLHPIHLDLIDYGFVSIMVETSELIHYQHRLFDPKTLIVAVSQSGQSAETVRLLEVNRRRSAVVGITNTADSPLAKEADAAIVTRAGKEFSVSCKTYLASLMGLKWLSDILCSGDLGRSQQELGTAVPAVGEYLNHWREHVEAFTQRLKGIRDLFMVGRGASLAAVGTGALTVKESDHFHAEGMSSAAFRHGPFEMLSDDNFVLVFEGDSKTRDLNVRLLDDIRGQRGRAELVGEGGDFPPCNLPKVPPSVRPIIEVLPAQMITLALAALTRREAGRFERATKITATE